MSLDVTLYYKACGADGKVVEGAAHEVFEYNITHNLNEMAAEGGFYKHLWHPEELNITKAAQLIEPLTLAIQAMHADPLRFKKHNPENGWGSYASLLTFITDYKQACQEYPEAYISVSR